MEEASSKFFLGSVPQLVDIRISVVADCETEKYPNVLRCTNSGRVIPMERQYGIVVVRRDKARGAHH